MGRRTLPYAAGVVICLMFGVLGLLLIPYPGAQYDEVLFGGAIHDPAHIEYAVETGFGLAPVMVMTYVGSLKALLYMPIVHWFGGTHATLRLPVLGLGMVSIWLFFVAVRRMAGARAALLAALLLATDVVYLLTCVFDWGPVAIQHVLFGAMLYCGVRYGEDGRARWLLGGGLAAGLALWDKAIFVWLMAGYGVAMVAVFPGVVWGMVRRWKLAAALVGGFAVGAAPFLFYNVVKPLNTFRANVQVDEQSVPAKLYMLDRTMDGSGLLGYIVRETPEGAVQGLKRWEKIPLFLNGKLGAPGKSVQHLLLVAVLLLAPIVCWFGPWRRAALFFVGGAALSYALMLVTRRAGGAAHHTILLWPAPQILLALLVAQVGAIWGRRGWRVAGAVVVICAVSNLTVYNTHLAEFIACGPGLYWTDAIRPLVNEIGATPGRTVFAVDWGITQQLEWYGNGRIGFHRTSDGIVLGLPERESVAPLEKALADPATLFVTHPEGGESFVGVRKKMLDFAGERGYRDTIVSTIADRHGVVRFEIHEFRK